MMQAPEDAYEKAEFVLPGAYVNNDRIKRYLIQERKLSPEVVDFFIGQRMIYESVKTHNVVFVGRDADNKPRHASLRGTYTGFGQKAFKGSVTGSDTRYTFNLVRPESDKLIVCEAPIDCMSYMELFDDLKHGPCNYLALTGTHDRSLEQFLSAHDHIKRIVLALDSDEPGQTAAKKIQEKYTKEPWKDRGYEIEISSPEDFKDFNEMLVDVKGRMVANL